MARIGVVFSNLGTPQAPTPKAVGQYLSEFLMDPYVIQIPFIARWLLVKGIISKFRAKKSAANYQKIWTDKGSPLLLETQSAAKALQKSLGNEYKVAVAMRYGEPSFQKAREELKDCERIIFFPQYPQYAESTIETSIVHFKKYFGDLHYKIIEPYYKNPHYIKSYGMFLKNKLNDTPFDHLLMSFHGLPESHILKTDPTKEHCLRSSDCCDRASDEVLKMCYKAQCVYSAKALASCLNLNVSQYSLSFQSRLGRQKWLGPSTEETLRWLGEKGVKRLAVICPGFSVDGLESLEEISMGGREIFLSSGGEFFYFVPCLNSDSGWIEACVKILKET